MLDKFIDESASIIVGKCLRVGPVNILLRANVEIEIIYVVKGGEMPKTVTVDSQYGMQVGNYYMLASKFAPTETAPEYALIIVIVIPVASADEAEKLKTLPQRIAVDELPSTASTNWSPRSAGSSSNSKPSGRSKKTIDHQISQNSPALL